MLGDGQSGKYVLVIDLGTGGPKEGCVAACASAPVQVFFLPDGGAEHDPAEWWSSITTCVKQVLQTSGVSPRAVIAVAVTGMWSDVVSLLMHRQANPRIHNVIGMGLLAFNRLGLVKVEDIPGMIKFDGVFEPDPKNRLIYDRMFTQFLAAKDRIRPIFHELNK